MVSLDAWRCPNADAVQPSYREATNPAAGFGNRRRTVTPSSVLNEAADRLKGFDQEAVLSQWNELFRTGLLAWGLNFSNPNQPWFHITGPGKQALANATRDPSNPAGYLRHLQGLVSLDPITESYLKEALECYVAGYFRAAAVLVGAGAESVVLRLRDKIAEHIKAAGQPVPAKLEKWQIKTVVDALDHFLKGRTPAMPPKLREEYDAFWSGFSSYIRAVRNDVGHPVSVDPIQPEQVHAALLMFPSMAGLADKLSTWAMS